MMDESALRVRVTQYYLLGRGLAEMHRAGLTFESESLLELDNFVVISEQCDLQISPLGTARVLPFDPTPENRAASMRTASITVLKPYWDTFGRAYQEKAEEFGQGESARDALSILEPYVSQAHEARLLQSDALKLSAEGKHADSIKLTLREIAIFEDLGLTVPAGRLRVNLGGDYASLGDDAAALANYEEAYAIARRNHDAYGLILACASLVLYHGQHGDVAAARRYAQEGLTNLPNVSMPPGDEEAVRQVLEGSTTCR